MRPATDADKKSKWYTAQYDGSLPKQSGGWATQVTRIAYVNSVARAVKRGGHVIVSTFGPEGPTKCSGLEVMRYEAESLHDQFGARFRLVESSKELHHTPFGTTQQFLYCYCRIDEASIQKRQF